MCVPSHCTLAVQRREMLCNGPFSEKTPRIFRPSLPVKYVTSISGPHTHTHTHTHTHAHTHTHKPNYRNPRCACAPGVNNIIIITERGTCTDKAQCSCRRNNAIVSSFLIRKSKGPFSMLMYICFLIMQYIDKMSLNLYHTTWCGI